MKNTKAYWNLGDLEIQEWFKCKEKGFLLSDVRKLQKEINKQVERVFHRMFLEINWEDSSRGFINPELIDSIKDEIRFNINKSFGINDENT